MTETFAKNLRQVLGIAGAHLQQQAVVAGDVMDLALLGGAGALVLPAFEVRLVA